MLKFRLQVFIGLISLFLIVTACSKPRYDLGILAGTIIDGNAGPTQMNKLILINNGRIEAIKDAGEKNNYQFKTLVDAHDQFIIPGLYDMHGHLTMNYRSFNLTGGMVQAHVDYNRQSAEWSSKTLLYYGITTVRETGDFLEEGLALKKAIDSNRLVGPRIFTCGPLLETGTPAFNSMSVGVNSPEEARAEVRRQANAQVDFIKIYATVPPQILKAIIEEAHKYKKRVIGHLGVCSWREALDAGIDGFVHPGSFCDTSLADLESVKTKAFLQLMSKKQIANDPTLIAMKSFLNVKYGDSLVKAFPFVIPMEVLHSWDAENKFIHTLLGRDYNFAKDFQLYSDYTKAAYAAGVKLLVGSDFNNQNVIPGYSLHQELELMSRAGIPNHILIKMATHDAAEWLGELNETGTLEKGKRADLVILNKNPLKNISNTLQIDRVILNGNIIARDSLVVKK